MSIDLPYNHSKREETFFCRNAPQEKEMDGPPGVSEKRRPTRSIRCPKCGGQVHVAVIPSGLFCGIRAVASCKNGCQWDADEQQRLDADATDSLFS